MKRKEPSQTQWYFHDDGPKLWREFSPYHVACLETAWALENVKTVSLVANNVKYKVNIKAMVQTNAATQRERKVCRGTPQLTEEELAQHCATCTNPWCLYAEQCARFCSDTLCLAPPMQVEACADHGDDCMVPASLFPRGSAVVTEFGLSLARQATDGKNCAVRDVQMNTPEFDKVREQLCTAWGPSPGRPEIVRLQSVANFGCFRRYEVERMNLGGERLLFHGSRCTPPHHIYAKDGLDCRLGKVSGYYGQGIYFSTSSHYSDKFAYALTDGLRQMMLCAVLTGRCKAYGTERDNTLRRAPEGYDSVSGADVSGRAPMYVVFNNAQSYVRFVVTYRVRL